MTSGTDKRENQKPPINENTCFVIMPFGGFFDHYFRDIYKPAIEESGLIPKRADDIYRPSTIIQDIWNLTKDSKLVLADLTGKNANVFYELGLAHALAKPAILITESIEFVPFDLRALRVIEFDKNYPNWGTILKEKIKISIKETLSSPLNSVLPTFLEIKDDVKQKGRITKQEKAILELKQDVELIKSNIRSGNMGTIPFPISFFSPREMDVMHLLGSGFSSNTIAEKFDLSRSEISLIIKRIFYLTGTNSIKQLIEWVANNLYFDTQ